MALSKDEVLRLENILTNTKGFRDLAGQNRSVPENYRIFMDKTTRGEEKVRIPGQENPVSCYITEAIEKPRECPVHINIHGGGFYYGHSEDDDLYCAHIAAEIKGIVVDIDYALTPAHPFPAAFEQCYEVARWVFRMCDSWGADPRRVSMGGQSAGGNLTAAVAIKAAQTGDFTLRLQVLEYPALDFATPPLKKTTGNELDESMAARYQAFSDLYTDGDPELLQYPLVSPIIVTDSIIDSLPEALIVTGGKDSLRTEAEEYGLRLVRRGVPVTMKRFCKSRHGFTVRMQDEWEDSQRFVINELKKAVYGR